MPAVPSSAAQQTCDCQEPAAAFDGNNFIVTFSKGIYEDVNDYNVIANRINNSGQILDADGLIIAGGADIQKSPAILFNGENYLFAWEDNRTGNDQINAAFIDTSGVVSPVDGFNVSLGYNNQLFGDVAFDGINYMAVWCDTRNDVSMNVYAARISELGLVLDQQAIAVTTGDEDCFDPAIAFNGTSYLVVWEKGSRHFRGKIVDNRDRSRSGRLCDISGHFFSEQTRYCFRRTKLDGDLGGQQEHRT